MMYYDDIPHHINHYKNFTGIDDDDDDAMTVQGET